MSSFRIISDASWPNLTGWERVVKMSWAECDTQDYFAAWNRPWGSEVSQGTTLWRTIEGLDLSEFGYGHIRFAYLAIVTLSTGTPDVAVTEDYIKHKENLCYPVPWGSNVRGRARFLGATINNRETKLVFLLVDPEIEKEFFRKGRDQMSRLLN